MVPKSNDDSIGGVSIEDCLSSWNCGRDASENTSNVNIKQSVRGGNELI